MWKFDVTSFRCVSHMPLTFLKQILYESSTIFFGDNPPLARVNLIPLFKKYTFNGEIGMCLFCVQAL